MQGKRIDRVGHLLQMELSQLVVTRLKDPRLGFVTITHVDVTPDLRSACVFYSVLGDTQVKENTQAALEKAAGFLQREVSASVKLRYTPRLIFRRDDSLDRAGEIDDVIREIHKDDPASDEPE